MMKPSGAFFPGRGVSSFETGIGFEKMMLNYSSMLPQPNLLFLREKILDLKNAIFTSQHSSLLKLPTTIISIDKMDDLGQLWFFVPRPQQALHEFDREF